MARIRTEGPGKRYGEVWAVRDLDLDVAAGEVFGFLGPNGAGKSTTIRLLLGMARPTAGRAWLAGHPAENVARAHEQVAYVPADVALWPQLTGREVLAQFASVMESGCRTLDLNEDWQLADTHEQAPHTGSGALHWADATHHAVVVSKSRHAEGIANVALASAGALAGLGIGFDPVAYEARRSWLRRRRGSHPPIAPIGDGDLAGPDEAGS